jgi:hypothetical protein
MAEPVSSTRATRSGGLQQIHVGPKVGTLYVSTFIDYDALTGEARGED